MELEGFLADSVVSAEGKLFVQGGAWNIVNVSEFPFRMPRCGIAIVVRVPYTATNQTHKFELSLLDEDGGEFPLSDAPPGVEAVDGKIHRLGSDFNVGRPPTIEPGDEQLVALAINIDGLTFENPGRYEFIAELDGSEAKRLPFRVALIPQMAPVYR